MVAKREREGAAAGGSCAALARQILQRVGAAGVVLEPSVVAEVFGGAATSKRPRALGLPAGETDGAESAYALNDALLSALPCGQEYNTDFAVRVSGGADAAAAEAVARSRRAAAELELLRQSTPACIAMEDADIFFDAALTLCECVYCKRPVLHTRFYEHVLRCCPNAAVPALVECTRQVANIGSQLARGVVERDMGNCVLAREVPELYFAQLLDEEDGNIRVRFGRHGKRIGKLYESHLLAALGMANAALLSADEATADTQAGLTAEELSMFRPGQAYRTSDVDDTANGAGECAKPLSGQPLASSASRRWNLKRFTAVAQERPRAPAKDGSTRAAAASGTTTAPAELLQLDFSWARLMQLAMPPLMQRNRTMDRSTASSSPEPSSAREGALAPRLPSLAAILYRTQPHRSGSVAWLTEMRRPEPARPGAMVYHGQSFFAQPGTFLTDPVSGKPRSTAAADARGPRDMSTAPPARPSAPAHAAAPRMNVFSNAPLPTSGRGAIRMSLFGRQLAPSATAANGSRRHGMMNPSQVPSAHTHSNRSGNSASSGSMARPASPSLSPNRSPHLGYLQAAASVPVDPCLAEWLRRDGLMREMLANAQRQVLAGRRLTPEDQRSAWRALEQRLMQQRLVAILQSARHARQRREHGTESADAHSILSDLPALSEQQRHALYDFRRRLLEVHAAQVMQQASRRTAMPPQMSLHTPNEAPVPSALRNEVVIRSAAVPAAGSTSTTSTPALNTATSPPRPPSARASSASGGGDVLATIDKVLGIERSRQW